jgi:dTDP-4-amino-4,6-dideoxygalactose transaminase
MNRNSIFVSQPSLADLNEFTDLLTGVWDRSILTHNGPLVQQLENQIKLELNLENFVSVSNGTLAIQMAIKALGLKGEIITTPFTWIATLSAIQWEGCTPVFCDIDPRTLNIDPAKIENAINEKTVAIMPVHVFGNPCDVEAIDRLAKKYNLKVIYDAAHAFGSTYLGVSLFNYGDISATSLHATKLFNTAEGGGCITKSNELAEKLRRIRFFGHDENKNIVEPGFNAKLTEIHAALGIVNLKYFKIVLQDRKSKYFYYKEKLKNANWLSFQFVDYGEPNYSYFPIIFDSEETLLRVEMSLNKENIYPRRYFHPSVNTMQSIVDYVPMPISEKISKTILCLPLYYKLDYNDIDKISKIILSNG